MSDKQKERALPSGRVGRFGRFARMAGGVAAGMLSEGAKQVSKGNRPKMSDLMLTPKNMQRVTEQLATMRGAAMKVGQLLSMETQDFLPKELADILAQLRNRAFIMPRDQLEATLIENYGEDWQDYLESFDWQPLASASIGQVHRAVTHEGEQLALKIQYPGVKKSIDSDVDNISGLLRVTRLIPKQVDLAPILEDAKKQLHEEADYELEANHIRAFSNFLDNDKRFILPEVNEEWTTSEILAMNYCAGEDIEILAEFDATLIDEQVSNLFDLLFIELFKLRTMQTDANFANYLFNVPQQKLVLLDFGATREFKKSFVIDYKRLMRAVQDDDAEAIVNAADKLGYGAHSASQAYRDFLVRIFRIALEPLATPGAYDFKSAQITKRLADTSDEGLAFREYWQAPPTDLLYLHRKIGGLFLLASRLGARVNVHALVHPYLQKLALD